MVVEANSARSAEEHTRRMGVLRIMNGSGDTSVAWDRDGLAAADPEAQAAVAEAERLFAKARSEGAVAFRINADSNATKLTEFDPDAEEILVVPAMVGG
jgi:hypothetical protein